MLSLTLSLWVANQVARHIEKGRIPNLPDYNDIAQSCVARSPSRTGFRRGLERYNLPAQCYRERGRLERAVDAMTAPMRDSTLYRLLFRPRAPMDSWYQRDEALKLFDAQNGLGMFIKKPPPEIEQAYDRLFQVLQEFKEFCEAHDIAFALLIFPQRFQVQPEDWRATVKAYYLAPDAFDLMAPNRRITQFCRETSMVCIDPTKPMAMFHDKTTLDLYLPLGDMHWNRYGHRAWVAGARPSLERFLK